MLGVDDRKRVQQLLLAWPFGEMAVPYTSFGKVDTLDLLEPRELSLFAFYWHNRNRYRYAADVGANVGLHTLVMARCGWKVWSFEPNPLWFVELRDNISRNGVPAFPVNAAVSDFSGEAEFVRVVDNETASHLVGRRDHHGATFKTTVRVMSADLALLQMDFAKLDCEGAEAEILCSIRPAMATRCEFMVEVPNRRAAEAIFDRFSALGVGMWSQRLEWKRAQRVDDLPHHYSDGHLFIGQRGPFKEVA